MDGFRKFCGVRAAGGIGLDLLVDRGLYYWGDLDSNGFAFLALMRQYFPQLRSFLMDEATLLAGQETWVKELSPYVGDMDSSCLTDDEFRVLKILTDGPYGQNLRLEQERIPFSYISDRLAKL